MRKTASCRTGAGLHRGKEMEDGYEAEGNPAYVIRPGTAGCTAEAGI